MDDLPVALRPKGARSPLYADIRATRDDQQIIIAEVKCFTGEHWAELYTAIGQYLVYRHLIHAAGASIPLYLAVPQAALYGTLGSVGLNVMLEAGIQLLVVDLVNEEIVEWLP